MADQQGGPEGWRAIGAELLYWPQLERKLKKPRGGPTTDQRMLAHVGGFVYQNNIIIVLIKMRIMRMTKCEKLGLAVP